MLSGTKQVLLGNFLSLVEGTGVLSIGNTGGLYSHLSFVNHGQSDECLLFNLSIAAFTIMWYDLNNFEEGKSTIFRQI